MTILRTVCFTLLGVFLTSCSHAPVLPTARLEPGAFWKDQERRAKEADRISGKIHLRIEGKKNSVSGRGRFLAELPERLLLELRDPLGRVQYILAVGEEKVVAYFPRQKIAYLDAPGGAAYVKRFLGLDISLEQFQQLLLGLLPLRGTKARLEGWRLADAQATYESHVLGLKYPMAVSIDAATGALRSVDLRSGASNIHVAYENFEPCCGEATATGNVALAQTVKLSLAAESTAVEVEWEDISRYAEAKNAETFRVALPDDVKKIPLN